MQKILLLRALDALLLWHGCFSCDPGMCALGFCCSRVWYVKDYGLASTGSGVLRFRALGSRSCKFRV